jgi:biotin transport system substrate-specific component
MNALPETVRSRSSVRDALLAVGGSLCIALSAKIALPIGPVPMTMQSLAVLMVGAALGPRLGMAAVLAYLAEGASGLPVFAGWAAGPAVLAGPTAGYLIGFVPAAGAAGWLVRRGWGRGLRMAATLLIGHAILFVPGVAWLATGIGWSGAVAFGLTPFLAGTLVKTGLGVALAEAVRRRG